MSAEPQRLHPVLRPLREADLDAVMAIEEAAYPFPWTRGIFSECLRVGYGCYGLQLGDALVAYVIFNWAAGESHLLNLCVHPEYQRQGLGRLLLEQVLVRAEGMGCDTLFLEVRPSNPGALRMYEKRGFRVIGRRPAYYRAEGGREDAIVMQIDLDTALSGMRRR